MSTYKVKISIAFLLLISLIGCSKKTEFTVEKVEKEAPLEVTEQVSPEPARKDSIRISPDSDLLVYVRSDYQPFSWEDEEGRLTGWVVDVETAVFEEMGQNYRLIPYTDTAQAIQDMKSGLAHCVLAVPVTPDFEKIMILGQSWVNLDLYIFTREGTTDIGGETREESIKSLFGHVVGVQARGLEYNIFREYKEIQLEEFESGTIAMRKLASGEVAAKAEFIQTGLFQAKEENLPIKPVGVPIFSVKGGIGFNLDMDPQIVESYNAALQRLQDRGVLDQLYAKWFES